MTLTEEVDSCEDRQILRKDFGNWSFILIQLFMLSFFESLFNEPRWDGLGEFVDTVRESAPWPGGLMA